MNKMKENEKMYLTPKVSVVSFVVEGGFLASPDPDTIQTANPATSYQDVDQSYNDWRTI